MPVVTVRATISENATTSAKRRSVLRALLTVGTLTVTTFRRRTPKVERATLISAAMPGWKGNGCANKHGHR